MNVNSIQAAWDEVKRIFPEEFKKDEESSSRSGYPVYRSTTEYYDYICELGDRLEVNLKKNNETINIWIVEEDKGEDFDIIVVAKTGETRMYSSYDKYRKDFRFFWSSGKEDHTEGSTEHHFETIMKSLRQIDEDGGKYTSKRNGVDTTFVYRKFARA